MFSQTKTDIFFRKTYVDCVKSFLKSGRNAECTSEQTRNSGIAGQSTTQYSPWINHFRAQIIKRSSMNEFNYRCFCTAALPNEKPASKPGQLSRTTREVLTQEEEALKNARLTRVIEYIRLMVTSDKPIIMEDLRVIKLLQLINEAQIDKTDKSHTRSGKYPGRSYEYKDKGDYRDKISPTSKVDDSTPLRTTSSWGRPMSRHLSTGNIIHFRSFCCSSSNDTKNLIGEDCTMTKSVMDAINTQINLELFASYTYLNIASFFDRSDVALPGFYSYFMFMSEDETKHALTLINFLNSRGGKVKYFPIETPENMEIKDARSAMSFALALERDVTGKIILLQEESDKMKDAHTSDFIITTYIYEQFNTIREMELILTQLKTVETGLGIYIVDKDLYDKFESKRKKVPEEKEKTSV